MTIEVFSGGCSEIISETKPTKETASSSSEIVTTTISSEGEAIKEPEAKSVS